MAPSSALHSRHAIYFAPAQDHPLWHAGCTWLGRDPSRPGAPPPPRPEVSAPWRYGWHATLKAPLRLAPGRNEAAWLAAVQALASTHARFAMPPLAIGELDDFLAVRPREPLPANHPLRRLADACVRQLDTWRAAPAPAELDRYRWDGMSERQRQHVERYGYAHVFEDWRFHLTLSNSLGQWPAARRAALRAEAEQHFAAALQAPLLCDALCVFVEPAAGALFELRHRFALGAP